MVLDEHQDSETKCRKQTNFVNDKKNLKEHSKIKPKTNNAHLYDQVQKLPSTRKNRNCKGCPFEPVKLVYGKFEISQIQLLE